MKIEVLFVPGCPNLAPAMARLREVLSDAGVAAPIEEIPVCNHAAADALAFPGSPTIRINGRDIAGEAEALSSPTLACRLYATGRGAGIPPLDLLRCAVLAAHRGKAR